MKNDESARGQLLKTLKKLMFNNPLNQHCLFCGYDWFDTSSHVVWSAIRRTSEHQNFVICERDNTKKYWMILRRQPQRPPLSLLLRKNECYCQEENWIILWIDDELMQRRCVRFNKNQGLVGDIHVDYRIIMLSPQSVQAKCRAFLYEYTKC